MTDLIIELDYLRKKQLRDTTHPAVFFQLKSIFHSLESIGSARIEGNLTAVVEFMETKIGRDDSSTSEEIREIENIEKVMKFIDENVEIYRNFYFNEEYAIIFME